MTPSVLPHAAWPHSPLNPCKAMAIKMWALVHAACAPAHLPSAATLLRCTSVGSACTIVCTATLINMAAIWHVLAGHTIMGCCTMHTGAPCAHCMLALRVAPCRTCADIGQAAKFVAPITSSPCREPACRAEIRQAAHNCSETPCLLQGTPTRSRNMLCTLTGNWLCSQHAIWSRLHSVTAHHCRPPIGS